MESIGRGRKLQILWTQSGVFRNSGQHARPDFYSIVKRPYIIAPLRMRQNGV